MQKLPTIIWNTARGVWEKPAMESLLCEHLEPFSETWPTEGTMLNGQVFELPTQAHRTTDSESSSSLTLRTPSVTDSTGGAISEKQARERNRMVKVADQAAELAFLNGKKVSSSIATSLMPTPNTMDHLPARTAEQKAANKGKGGYANVRETVINELMPTPKALDGIKGSLKTSAERESDGRQVDLPNVARDIVLPTPTTNGNDRKGPNYQSAGILQELEIANGILPKEYKDWDHAKEKVKWAEPIEGQEKTKLDNETNWGKFEPAIRRWEKTIGRPAPAPTKPDGKDGAHRLSSAFTEWMMGLPDGWITDCGLSRNDELKACGNGVVPQQAELALRILLEGIEIERGGEQVNLPTPTVMDQQDGKYFRSVAIKELAKGNNRGLNLNNIVETGLTSWQDGDKFEIVEGKAVKK